MPRKKDPALHLIAYHTWFQIKEISLQNLFPRGSFFRVNGEWLMLEKDLGPLVYPRYILRNEAGNVNMLSNDDIHLAFIDASKLTCVFPERDITSEALTQMPDATLAHKLSQEIQPHILDAVDVRIQSKHKLEAENTCLFPSSNLPSGNLDLKGNYWFNQSKGTIRRQPRFPRNKLKKEPPARRVDRYILKLITLIEKFGKRQGLPNIEAEAAVARVRAQSGKEPRFPETINYIGKELCKQMRRDPLKIVSAIALLEDSRIKKPDTIEKVAILVWRFGQREQVHAIDKEAIDITLKRTKPRFPHTIDYIRKELCKQMRRASNKILSAIFLVEQPSGKDKLDFP